MKKYIQPTIDIKEMNMSEMIALSFGDEKAEDGGTVLGKEHNNPWDEGSLW